MCINVVDRLRRKTSACDRAAHGVGGMNTVWMWRGHVVSVARRPVAGEFSVDVGAPCPRMLERLEHEHCPALGNDEPVTVPVKWQAGGLRVVVPGAEHPNHRKGAKGERRKRCF